MLLWYKILVNISRNVCCKTGLYQVILYTEAFIKQTTNIYRLRMIPSFSKSVRSPISSISSIPSIICSFLLCISSCLFFMLLIHFNSKMLFSPPPLFRRWFSWLSLCSCSTLTSAAVSYTHLRAHETVLDLVCRVR